MMSVFLILLGILFLIMLLPLIVEFFTQFLILLAVIIIGSVIWYKFYGKEIIEAGEKEERQQQYKKDKHFQDTICSLENFKESKKVYSDDKEKMDCLVVDEENKKIAILGYMVKPKVYNYHDLLEVKIVEDNVTVTKTARGSQIGGALLGGVLAGGAGAIIGGLSGKKETTEEVKKVELKILVNNVSNPEKNITFLYEMEPIKKTHSKYRQAISKADRWHDIIKVAIHKADKEDEKKEHNSKPEKHSPEYLQKPSPSIAEEIKKLHELLKEDIITQEEFKIQKEKLLS